MPHGDKTSADTAGPTIDSDEAEQLASSFVPVWRFDEAQFSAASALSNDDIAALAPTASGTTPSTRPTARPPSAPADAADVPLSTTQSFVAFETDPFAGVRDQAETIPAPTSASLETPVVAVAAAGAPPAAKPAAELYDFEEPKVVRGPSRGLLLGAGAGVAAILALLAVTLHRSESPAESTVAVQTSQAPESIPIPPPPPLPDPIEPPAVVPAAPTLSASRPESPAAPAAPQRASTDPAPARLRRANPPTKSVPEPVPAKSNAKPTVAVPDFGI
jgi:hypothetical protein